MATYEGPGFSITEAAKGAEAVTSILAQPDVLAEEQARSKILQTQSETEQMRLAAKKEYMAAEKGVPARNISDIYGKSPEGDPAIISGNNTYSFMQLSQELQQRKQSLAAEEKNLRLLAPEDRRYGEQTVERMQKDVDVLEGKLSKEIETHAGERFSLLDSINDEASLQGARNYYRREVEAIADKAIADGKMSPDNKERFVNDKVNSFLPQKYDANGKVKIATQKNGMLSIADQARMKREDSEAKKADAALKRADAQAQRVYNLQMKAIQSHNKDEIANSIRLTSAQLQDASRQIKEFEDKAAQYEADARSATDKAIIERDKQLADDYRLRAAELEMQKKPLEDVMKALDEHILPEDVKEKVTEADKNKTPDEKNREKFPNAPPIHSVIRGHRYMGGDPASEKSWVTRQEWKGKITVKGE